MFSRHARIVRALTALGLVGLILFSSTGAVMKRSAPAVVNIVVWQQFGGGHEQQAYTKFVNEFNSTHPGIHASVLPVLDNTKIVAAISGGHPPDVVNFGGSQNLGQYTHQGLLQPLDSYITGSHMDINAFVPAGWNAVTIYGKRWAVPFVNFNWGLIYNVKEFQQAGITRAPRTLEELDQDAAKLTIVKNGRIVRMGFIPNYPEPGLTLEDYAWLYGGNWFTGNKSTAASAANVQALQWETGYYKKYGAAKLTRFAAGFGQSLTAADGFESGKVAMIYDGEWNIAFAKENVPSMQVGAAPFPAPQAQAGRTGTSYLDTNPLTIPTGSPHPKEAFTFIQWLATNPAVSSEFATLVINLPQLKHVPQTSLFKDPRFQVFIKEANSPNAHAWPQNPVVAQFTTNANTAEAAALQGTKTPRQSLLDLQTTTQQALDSTH